MDDGVRQRYLASIVILKAGLGGTVNRVILSGLATGAVLLALLPSGAHAATDTTGPTVQLQSIAHLTVPSVISATGSVGPSGYFTEAVIKWSATDPSGVCQYQLYNDSGRSEPFLIYQGIGTSYTFRIGDAYADGAGYDYMAFSVRAQDCAGNWSSSGDPFFVQPGDRYVPGPTGYTGLSILDQTSSTYSAGWTGSTCTCFIDGTDTHAVKAGAWTTISYTGEVFGWISELGPARGSAKVYQDGVLKATVNLYAKANTGPVTVWSNWFPSAGPHTIKIVVVGTKGHARVDVDGFFTGPTF